jgi:4-amino-4-deoxy-L-arabinose transferase-like glycosyltransferase
MRRSWLERDELLITLAGAAIFFPFLGSVGLWDPWETHYAEVAREMIARADFVHPHWAGHGFFSKPVLPLWLIAIGLWITGSEPGVPHAPLGEWVEWGVRLPFAMLAILTLRSVAKIGRFIGAGDRRVGLLAALALATSPTFAYIAKQAIADMPLVAMTTAGISYLLPALAGATRVESTRIRKGRAIAFVVACAAPVPTLACLVPIEPLARVSCVAAGLITLGAVAIVARARDDGPIDAVIAASFFGLAALAKGLEVGAIVAPLVLAVVLMTRDLGAISRARPGLMIAVFLAVAAPWYLAMSLYPGRDDEGLTFVGRFWMHDNFARVTSGVHGDRGGAGYYLEQLLYGLFPWSAVVPFALGAAAMRLRRRDTGLIFVIAWAVWVYIFFTFSQTKLHHYVFPALPPIAILLGLLARDLVDEPRRVTYPMLALGAALFAVALRDLWQEPNRLVNLFTYKYDRDFPREVVVRPFLALIGGGGGALVIGLAVLARPRAALAAFGATAAVFSLWIVHHHFNMLSPHWSQAWLLRTYFRERAPGELLVAYQLNWRGETFYSRNEAIELMNQGAQKRLRELIDRPGRLFVLIEPQRFAELKTMVPAAQILDRSNAHFYLCVLEDP